MDGEIITSLPMFPDPAEPITISSAGHKDIKAVDMLPACASPCLDSSAISISSSSSDEHCCDHPDCNSWGPATFEESGAVDELLDAPDVLKQLTVAMKEFAATNEGRLHSTELRLLMRVL